MTNYTVKKKSFILSFVKLCVVCWLSIFKDVQPELNIQYYERALNTYQRTEH